MFKHLIWYDENFKINWFCSLQNQKLNLVLHDLPVRIKNIQKAEHRTHFLIKKWMINREVQNLVYDIKMIPNQSKHLIQKSVPSVCSIAQHAALAWCVQGPRFDLQHERDKSCYSLHTRPGSVWGRRPGLPPWVACQPVEGQLQGSTRHCNKTWLGTWDYRKGG